MAQHDPDTIYKALRLVPEFDGNPNVLTRFIKICDSIATQYLSSAAGSEFSNLCLLNGILNKISGTALCTLNSNGIPESWLGIRTALVNNFSDQRDETALYNDLSIATQGGKTPQEFYDHCQTLFSTIMTYVTLHETVPTTVEAKRELYKKVTMQAFIRGLKEPLGSRIRCMRPATVEKALEYVQEELNIIYLQQRSEPQRSQLTPRVALPPAANIPPRPHNFQVPVPNWPAPVGQRPAGPAQPFRFAGPNQYQQQGPAYSQKTLSAPPPNYNPRSNVFRVPYQNHPPSGPRPMSGVQRFTTRPLPPTNRLAGHDWNRSGNPPPTNYFKTREMNVNECASYDNSCYNYYQEPVYDYCADYNYSDSDYGLGFASDPTYFMTADDQPDDPQPWTKDNHAEPDFPATLASPKPG